MVPFTHRVDCALLEGMKMDHGPLPATRHLSAGHREGVPPSLANAADFIGVIRRQFQVIVVSTISVLVLAIAFVLFRPPSYVAATSVLITTHKPEIVSNQTGGAMMDPANVDSQLEILKSDQVMGVLIDKLQLREDPVFMSNSSLEAIIPWATGAHRAANQWDEQRDPKRIIEKLKKVIIARRVGVTNLLMVEARSSDPVKAARLSNGLVDGYIEDQLNVKRAEARKASEWLEERTAQLELQLRNVEKELNEYRSRMDQVRSERNELENKAQVLRNIYDNSLKRMADSSEMISYVPSDATIVSRALPPVMAQGPAGVLILAGSVFLGLGLGLLIGFAREQIDTTFRRPREVSELLGLNNVCVLPSVAWFDLDQTSNQFSELHGASILPRYAALRPASRFGTSVRAIKVAVDLEFRTDHCVVIGVISAVPGEGTSTVAANLAFLTNAAAGSLLIEAQPRSGTVTDQADPDGPGTSDDLVVGGAPGLVPILSNRQALPAIIRAARDKYKYIIVDLPPLLASPDGRAASRVIDCFVLVIRWGRTSRQAIEEAMTDAPEVLKKTVVAVLNGAPERALKRDEVYKGREFQKYFDA